MEENEGGGGGVTTVGSSSTTMVNPSPDIDINAHPDAGKIFIFTPKVEQAFSPIKVKDPPSPSYNIDTTDKITVSLIISTPTNDPPTTSYRTNQLAHYKTLHGHCNYPTMN